MKHLEILMQQLLVKRDSTQNSFDPWTISIPGISCDNLEKLTPSRCIFGGKEWPDDYIPINPTAYEVSLLYKNTPFPCDILICPHFVIVIFLRKLF